MLIKTVERQLEKLNFGPYTEIRQVYQGNCTDIVAEIDGKLYLISHSRITDISHYSFLDYVKDCVEWW